MKTPEEMRQEYRSQCDIYRKGGVVYSVEGQVVFNGYNDSTKNLGINAAKRYVSKHSGKSYTIRD